MSGKIDVLLQDSNLGSDYCDLGQHNIGYVTYYISNKGPVEEFREFFKPYTIVYGHYNTLYPWVSFKSCKECLGSVFEVNHNTGHSKVVEITRKKYNKKPFI